MTETEAGMETHTATDTDMEAEAQSEMGMDTGTELARNRIWCERHCPSPADGRCGGRGVATSFEQTGRAARPPNMMSNHKHVGGTFITARWV